MTGQVDHRVVEELLEVLGEARRLHEELLAVLRRKLEAIRRAEMQAVHSCGAREALLVDRIRRNELRRRGLVERLGRQLAVPAGRARPVRLTELAEQLGEPMRSRLLVMAAGLRDLLGKIGDTNRVIGMVSEAMLEHFRQVYEAMRQAVPGSGLYSPAGRDTDDVRMNVLDAVG